MPAALAGGRNYERILSRRRVVVIRRQRSAGAQPKDKSLRFHPDGRPAIPARTMPRDVCANLFGVAGVDLFDLKSVWPACPLKGDISNWIEAGGTIGAA